MCDVTQCTLRDKDDKIGTTSAHRNYSVDIEAYFLGQHYSRVQGYRLNQVKGQHQGGSSLHRFYTDTVINICHMGGPQDKCELI